MTIRHWIIGLLDQWIFGIRKFRHPWRAGGASRRRTAPARSGLGYFLHCSNSATCRAIFHLPSSIFAPSCHLALMRHSARFNASTLQRFNVREAQLSPRSRLMGGQFAKTLYFTRVKFSAVLQREKIRALFAGKTVSKAHFFDHQRGQLGSARAACQWRCHLCPNLIRTAPHAGAQPGAFTRRPASPSFAFFENFARHSCCVAFTSLISPIFPMKTHNLAPHWASFTNLLPYTQKMCNGRSVGVSPWQVALRPGSSTVSVLSLHSMLGVRCSMFDVFQLLQSSIFNPPSSPRLLCRFLKFFNISNKMRSPTPVSPFLFLHTKNVSPGTGRADVPVR